jgi:hypothetical protein
MEFAEAEVIHQPEVIGREGVPAVIRLHVGHRLAGVALVHGDDGEFVGERRARIHPREAVGIRCRRAAPHLHLRLQPARRIEQDWKA